MKKQTLILTLFTMSIFAFSCKKSESDAVDKLVGNWRGYSNPVPGSFLGMPDYLYNDSVLLVITKDKVATLSDINGLNSYIGSVIYTTYGFEFYVTLVSNESFKGVFRYSSNDTFNMFLAGYTANKASNIFFKKQK